MKTQTATVRVMLLQKANKEGLYPIVIRAQWNGRCEKRTGISIPKKYWSDRDERVKSTYPNAQMLNNNISEMYNKVIERRSQLESLGDYKVEDLFTETVVNVNKLSYTWLQDKLMYSRALTYGTTTTYRSAHKLISKWLQRSDWNVTELNATRCRAFMKFLQNEGIKDSTIFLIMAKIGAVWNYAIELDLIDPRDHPYRKFNPKKYLKADFKKKAITRGDIVEIEGILMDMLVKSPKERFLKRDTNEFALAMYVLGYRFGGLALIDMSNLKKNQISIIDHERTSFYLFSEVRRQKTNQPVPIIVRKDLITSRLMSYYLEGNNSEYLFPLQSHYSDERRQYRDCVEMSRILNYHLKQATGKDITYYSCRHSFATHYMESEGANPIALASLMGRSLGGIFGYVKQIQTAEDIIKEKTRMGL